MKMNTRLFAAFTAAVITVCASSMSVFAANEDHTAEQTFTGETNTWDPTHDDQTVDSDTYDPSAKVNVNLSNDPSYTVTIPADVSFGDSFDAQTNEVKVEDVFLEKGQSVKVTVSSKNDYKLLLDGNDADMSIPYSVTSDKAELDEVITVASGSKENKGTGTATLTYSIADGTDIPVAGAYSDILTFNIAVEDAATDPVTANTSLGIYISKYGFQFNKITVYYTENGSTEEKSESFTTVGTTSFTGEKFKITATSGSVDGDGVYLREGEPINIESLNGEIITKVDLTIGWYGGNSWSSYISTTPSATISGNDANGGTMTLTL